MTVRRYVLSCTVDAYRDGWLLAEFLGHRFRYHPSDVWAVRLAEGAVSVNGDVAAADREVRRGDRIEYVLWHEEPEVDFAYAVLLEDEHVLAVAKSGNLPVHAGGRYIRHTLIAELRATRGSALRLTHRLDRETSGVVLLAKSREAARAIEREFHERRVRKEYLALVHGRPPDELVVDAPIARGLSPGGTPLRVVDLERGKSALTRFFRLATRDLPAAAVEEGGGRLGEVSLVLARPESGRTNQIRVHALHAGHPILGDKLYGPGVHGSAPGVRVGPGFPQSAPGVRVGRGASDTAPQDVLAASPRHLLHGLRLVLRHPSGQGLLDLTAPPPGDFAGAWGGPLPPFAVNWPGIDPVPPPGAVRVPGLPS
ncbi:MAG: pseudouridine synthase [bacterium]